jgi:hypothetical protein
MERAAAVLRFSFMRTSSVLALATLFAALAASPAHAQATVVADSGRFIVFQGDVPVAHERNTFLWTGDSLVITAFHQRTMQDEQGVKHPFTKTVAMVVDSRDLGLKSYTSIQDFQGHRVTRGLVPGDTSISYYQEFDGAGNAMRVTQPPGRLYVMDGNLFSLFEVVCRSLAPRTFTSRPVQILAMADTLATPVATVTRGPADTLSLGSKRVPVRRYTFSDESATFELWADARGRMLKLAHASGLHVEREPDTPAPARRRARGAR